jgi:hypothetical protein
MRDPLMTEADIAQGRHVVGDPLTETFTLNVNLSADGAFVSGDYRPNGPVNPSLPVREEHIYNGTVSNDTALAHMLGVRL